MAKFLGTGKLIVDDNDVPWFYDEQELRLSGWQDKGE